MHFIRLGDHSKQRLELNLGWLMMSDSNLWYAVPILPRHVNYSGHTINLSISLERALARRANASVQNEKGLNVLM